MATILRLDPNEKCMRINCGHKLAEHTKARCYGVRVTAYIADNCKCESFVGPS